MCWGQRVHVLRPSGVGHGWGNDLGLPTCPTLNLQNNSIPKAPPPAWVLAGADLALKSFEGQVGSKGTHLSSKMIRSGGGGKVEGEGRERARNRGPTNINSSVFSLSSRWTLAPPWVPL